MSKPLYLDPEYSEDPYLSPFIEAAGEDHELELDEMCGMSFVGLDDYAFTLDTEFLCVRAAQQITKYQWLLERDTKLQGKGLWDFSLRIVGGSFTKEFTHTDSDIYPCKPQLVGYDSDDGNKEIHTDWLRESDGSVYARLVLAEDPLKSTLTLQDQAKEIPLVDLSLTQAWLFRATAENYNSILYLECYDERVYPFRKILYSNIDFINRGIREGSFVDDVTPVSGVSVDSLSVLGDFVTGLFGPLNCWAQTRDRISHQQAFLWQGHSFTLYGEEVSVQPEMVDQLVKILDSFPEAFKNYYQFSGEGQLQSDFDFCVVTREEITRLTGSAKVAAMYHPGSKILYIPEEMFGYNLIDPMQYALFFHELCHATFDHMSPDMLSMKLSPAFAEAFGLIRDMSQIFPESIQNNVFIGGVIICGAAAPYFILHVMPIRLIGILAILFAVDYYINAPVDRSGILADEMEKALDQMKQGALVDDVAVSPYALLDKDVAEFGAETLFSYFFTDEYTIQSGYYHHDGNSGLKTQEELIAKNPVLYLAFEAFFSEDSTQRYNIDIFQNKEKAALIDEVLWQARQEDGTVDVQKSRELLFAGLSHLEEIERKEAVERP